MTITGRLHATPVLCRGAYDATLTRTHFLTGPIYEGETKLDAAKRLWAEEVLLDDYHGRWTVEALY